MRVLVSFFLLVAAFTPNQANAGLVLDNFSTGDFTEQLDAQNPSFTRTDAGNMIGGERRTEAFLNDPPIEPINATVEVNNGAIAISELQGGFTTDFEYMRFEYGQFHSSTVGTALNLDLSGGEQQFQWDFTNLVQGTEFNFLIRSGVNEGNIQEGTLSDTLPFTFDGQITMFLNFGFAPDIDYSDIDYMAVSFVFPLAPIGISEFRVGSPVAIPEPSSFALFMAVTFVAGCQRRRKNLAINVPSN